jgi:hypothetical protein
LNRFARLRAEADRHGQYETACVAEEKLVSEGNETKETTEPQAKVEPKEVKPGTTFGFIFRLIVAGPMILLLLTLPFSGSTFGATIVAYIIAALLTWWLHNYATRVTRPLKQRENISSEDRKFYELE